MRVFEKIEPRDGEHPLATQGRKLHRELARAYGLVSASMLALTMAVLTDDTIGLGALTSAVLCTAVAVGYAVCARAHWRWSK